MSRYVPPDISSISVELQFTNDIIAKNADSIQIQFRPAEREREKNTKKANKPISQKNCLNL